MNPLDGLATAHLADALVRLGRPPRLAPFGLVPVQAGMRAAGRALPCRHRGSVDVFLERIDSARAGDVLVVDDAGGTGAGCVGDLVVREARAAGLGGLVVFGAHRDTAELREIGFPVFSLGRFPAGPTRVEPRREGDLERARVGEVEVSAGEFVLADDDGVVFLSAEDADEVLGLARTIAATERAQAERLAGGESLREQLAFAEFLARREADPGRSFREHLIEIGGAIET